MAGRASNDRGRPQVWQGENPYGAVGTILTPGVNASPRRSRDSIPDHRRTTSEPRTSQPQYHHQQAPFYPPPPHHQQQPSPYGRTSSRPHSRQQSHSRRVELRLFANQEEDVGMQSVEFTYAPEKVDDRRLFRRLRRAYRTRMLKWWMRYHLSFKTLKVIVPVQYRLLDGAPSDEPLFRRFYCAELTRCFKHPDSIPADEYVWVARFREHGERLAGIECGIGLEFRDGWATGRILVLGAVVITGMVALTIVWIVLGGDYGQVCNVMSFAMGTFTGMCALFLLFRSLDDIGRIWSRS